MLLNSDVNLGGRISEDVVWAVARRFGRRIELKHSQERPAQDLRKTDEIVYGSPSTQAIWAGRETRSVQLERRLDFHRATTNTTPRRLTHQLSSRPDLFTTSAKRGSWRIGSKVGSFMRW